MCYVADLRGRGESKPVIDKHARYGQTEAILEDIPAFIDKIEQLEGKTRLLAGSLLGWSVNE